MSFVSIENYVSHKKILTAEEVRKLPVGTVIQRHHFDRYGEHVWEPMTVVQSGKKKMLLSRDWRMIGTMKPITERENQCYTEV